MGSPTVVPAADVATNATQAAPAADANTEHKGFAAGIKSLFVKVMAGAGHLFTGVFSLSSLKKEAQDELQLIEQNVAKFIQTDLGALALDAVNLADAKFGKTNDDAARALAKSQFIADAKVAGHDLENMGKGVVDWMVQTAYTYAANVAAKLAAGAIAGAV